MQKTSSLSPGESELLRLPGNAFGEEQAWDRGPWFSGSKSSQEFATEPDTPTEPLTPESDTSEQNGEQLVTESAKPNLENGGSSNTWDPNEYDKESIQSKT